MRQRFLQPNFLQPSLLKPSFFRQSLLSCGFTLFLGIFTITPPGFAQALVPRTLELDNAKLEQEGLAVAQDARYLLQFQQIDEALARARLATQLAPRAFETWALLGIILGVADQNEPAVKALERALSLKRDNPGIYFSLGSAYFRQGKYNEAIKMINQGLAIKPDAPDEIFNLGNSHYKLNQFPQAIAQYRRALQIDRKFWPALNNIGLIQYEQGDRAGAIKSWQEAIVLDSKTGEPKMALAAALFAQGRADQAIPLAEAALRIDVRYGEVDFLKENLWGERLIADTRQVLANPKIKAMLAQLQSEPQRPPQRQ